MSSIRNEKLRIEGNKKYFGNAWMEKRDDIYLMHLNGSPYDVGYQHGILMSEEIKDGVVRMYASPFAGGEKSYSPKLWFLKKYINKKVFHPLEKTQPKDILDQLRGIADGSGLSFKTVFIGNHNAALSQAMFPIQVEKILKKFSKIGINIGACSSFAASKKATLNGKTIVGRNTDYGGITKWPKYQNVCFVEPEIGFNYVQVGTAGLVLWAPGMNEKGIVVCGHAMSYDDMTPHGWNVPAFTDAILRNAESIDDAIDILNDNPRGVSCGFVIIDGKTKDAIAAEVSTGKATIRRMENDSVVMTNIAISEEKRKIDIFSKYYPNEGCPGRYRRLLQLIDENYGKIDVTLGAEFMGDHIRFTTGTERTSYGIIATAYTVNSIVFSPEDLKLWVAVGPAPICNNPYIGLDLKEELKGIKSKVIPAILQGYRFQNPKKRLGMQKYNQAYCIFEENPTYRDKMIQLIREALTLDPEEIIYYQMLAKFLLHEGKYDEAIKAANQVFNLKQSKHEEAHSNLLLGILYDLKGEREEAISYYHKIEDLMKQEPEDPLLQLNKVTHAFARKYIKIPFTNKQLNEIPVSINFSQGTGIE